MCPRESKADEMRRILRIVIAWATVALTAPASGQTGDPIATLVARLDLEKYKATIKGLTQFGDRRQGTDRNRAAIDWIEAQLKSYGCPTDRIHYEYKAPPADGRGRGNTGRGANQAQGGGRLRGIRTRTGVNTDPMKQPDEKLRALNMQPASDGPREEAFCTKVGTTQADENSQVQANSKMAAESAKRAWLFEAANEKYASDYPAHVGSHMTNTDSGPFQDLIPAISLRENERGAEIGAGWDPQWHQPTDLYVTYTDKDFRLGLNAAQTTLGAIAQLTGATIKGVR